MQTNFILTTVCVLFFSLATMAKEAGNSSSEKSKKYIYHFTFENATADELARTESAAAALLNVTEVKSKFKSETGKGELILVVIEEQRKTEAEEQFSPKMVKDVLLQNGIDPIEFTVSEEENSK